MEAVVRADELLAIITSVAPHADMSGAVLALNGVRLDFSEPVADGAKPKVRAEACDRYTFGRDECEAVSVVGNGALIMPLKQLKSIRDALTALARSRPLGQTVGIIIEQDNQLVRKVSLAIGATRIDVNEMADPTSWPKTDQLLAQHRPDMVGPAIGFNPAFMARFAEAVPKRQRSSSVARLVFGGANKAIKVTLPQARPEFIGLIMPVALPQEN